MCSWYVCPYAIKEKMGRKETAMREGPKKLKGRAEIVAKALGKDGK